MLALAAYLQHERGGANWSVVVPITKATRWLAISSGSVILLGGLAVLVWPAVVVQWWPWPIGVLMLRIFAAWFSAFGAGLLWVLVERDWRRIAPLPTLMIAASGLDLLMIRLQRAQLATMGPHLWIYCAHLAGFGLLGLLMHWLQRPISHAPMVQPVGTYSGGHN